MTTQTHFSKNRCSPCLLLRSYLRVFYKILLKIYIYIFARPSAQKLNYLILQLALRGQGYNNCCSPEDTGESLFVKLLAKMDPLLCIDVGANIGRYSEALLSKTNAHVIAFEPLPGAFQSLSRLKSAYPDRLEVINKGLGSKDGVLELFYGSDDSELASFCTEVQQINYVGINNVNSIMVPVITLDNYFRESFVDKFEQIDLLKIDAEGYEYEVLAGAQQTILALRPKFIQIEYNWHQLFRAQTLKTISELIEGYNAYQMLPFGSGLVRRDLNLPESNIYHYSNFVFVRDDINLD